MVGWVFALVGLGLGLSSASLAASELAPHLETNALQACIQSLKGPFSQLNLEDFEVNYQSFVQPQTFADLQKIYDPKNQEKLLIAYPTFIPEKGSPGEDRGFGFHVVKRLIIPLPNGEKKIIDVNEQWAENQKNRGLFLPDEIRIKTRVVSGDRHVAGSERQYLFDSVRLAWNETNEISIARQTRYRNREGNMGMKPMRVPVSAPISCMACHDAGTSHYIKFLADGETRNHEAIVQDSYFKLSPKEMDGYQEYVDYLTSKKVPETFLTKVKRDLEDPVTAFAVPGLYEALEQQRQSFSWLGEDDSFRPFTFLTHDSQGVYERRGSWFIDANESVFEGKYQWWQPFTAVPRP